MKYGQDTSAVEDFQRFRCSEALDNLAMSLVKNIHQYYLLGALTLSDKSSIATLVPDQ